MYIFIGVHFNRVGLDKGVRKSLSLMVIRIVVVYSNLILL